MPTYISTVRFTQKGVENVKDTCKRAEAFRAEAKKMGVKIVGQYWTLGAFDGVIIFDAADEPTATALMLSLSSHGNVQTTTMRAFGDKEMKEILGKMM